MQEGGPKSTGASKAISLNYNNTPKIINLTKRIEFTFKRKKRGNKTYILVKNRGFLSPSST